WQVPGASAQASHCAVHAVLQHTPSTQNVDAHSAPAKHASPFFFLQAPAALQLLVPVQLSGSGALVIFPHAPRLPATLHAWQVPHTGASQHTPSTQYPDAHAEPSAHDWPRSVWIHVSASTPSPMSRPPKRTGHLCAGS